MRPVVERWLGEHRPKQYCAFSGGRTMLEHTLERALALAPAQRIVTVVGPGHGAHLRRHAPLPGLVLEQPANRETAPGLYLPLAHVLKRDPDAVALVMPSDHFIRPRERFIVEAERALAAAERHPAKMVLLAAPPARAEADYGWIEPGEPLPGDDAWTVARFHEKPEVSVARTLMDGGALWNTMILAARARGLWSLASRLRPDMMGLMDGLRASLGTGREDWALQQAYRRLPPVNFSKDIVERAPSSALLLPMAGVSWCDWGRPERVEETLAALGKRSPFEPAVFA